MRKKVSVSCYTFRECRAPDIKKGRTLHSSAGSGSYLIIKARKKALTVSVKSKVSVSVPLKAPSMRWLPTSLNSPSSVVQPNSSSVPRIGAETALPPEVRTRPIVIRIVSPTMIEVAEKSTVSVAVGERLSRHSSSAVKPSLSCASLRHCFHPQQHRLRAFHLDRNALRLFANSFT